MEMTSLNDIEIIDPNKPIGKGAFSKVFKCKHKKSYRTCALKMIDMDRLSHADCESLRLEIDLHEPLDHPYIVKFYDSIQVDDVVYFLLEYAGNRSLFDFIQSKRGLSERLALRFLYQSAAAVKYLHERSIIHRDLKPENLLLTEAFNIKLCDFGWSCRTDTDDKTLSMVCGTYEYMSPEICLRKPQTLKTDVWALGIILFEMLTGQPPYKPTSTASLKHLMETSPILIPSHLSTEMQDLLKGMLQMDPTLRFDINKVLTHPALCKKMGEIFSQVTGSEKAELEENYLENNGGTKLKLIKEVEEMIQKSNLRMKQEKVQPAYKPPEEVLPSHITKGKKIIAIGDPLSKEVKIEQTFVYANSQKIDPFESALAKTSEPIPVVPKTNSYDPSVAWKRVSTMNLSK